MSGPLDDVVHLLVTSENTPRNIDGMDHARCAALHNAIFKHAWIAAGRDGDAFTAQSRPWLEFHPHAAQDSHFHPSVLAFLREARALPLSHQINFFYYFWGLNCEVGGHEDCFPEDDRTVTLYASAFDIAGQPDGLVYVPSIGLMGLSDIENIAMTKAHTELSSTSISPTSQCPSSHGKSSSASSQFGSR
jgi:hypothetical protein